MFTGIDIHPIVSTFITTQTIFVAVPGRNQTLGVRNSIAFEVL